MDGNVVLRDVNALAGSFLTIMNSEVGSDVEGHQAAQLIVQGGTVGGRIRINGGGNPGVGASVNNVIVRGSDIVIRQQRAGIIFVGFSQVMTGGIRVSGNVTQDILQITTNNVARSIEVVENTGPSDKRVTTNAAGVAVRCTRNTPPFVGGPNFAPTVEGQCF